MLRLAARSIKKACSLFFVDFSYTFLANQKCLIYCFHCKNHSIFAVEYQFGQPKSVRIWRLLMNVLQVGFARQFLFAHVYFNSLFFMKHIF